MEYPTLITTGSTWPSIPGVRFTEEVAIHELGHQWFYGLLASNEPDEAWLDEGMNTWATGRVMEDLYGRRGTCVDFLGLRVGYGSLARAIRAFAPVREPVAQRSADFANPTSYAAHVYYGTDLLLRTLDRRVGRARLSAAVGRYARTFRFRHPTTEDVLGVLQRELGEAPIHDLVRPVLQHAARVDFRVRSVESDPVLETEGYVRRHGKRVRVDDPPEARPSRYRTTVLVTRTGEVVTPVTVQVTLADGHTVRLPWDAATRHHRFELVTDIPALSAAVAPGVQVAIDEDLTNDARRVSSASGGTAHLWSRLLYVAQTILQLVGP